MVKSFSKESWFVFALVLILSVGGLSYLDEESQRGTMFERYSSLRAEPDGVLGFYELCKARGKDARRWKKPLFDLPADATVIVIQPVTNWGAFSGMGLGSFDTFSKKEIVAVQRWVENGGTLIVFSSAQNQIYETFQLNAEASSKNEGDERSIATPVSFLPLTASAGELEIESRCRLSPKSDDWIPLYASNNGLIAATLPVEKGSVTAIGDPFLVSNSGINKGDNAELLGSIIRQSSGPIIFDEARHGLSQEQNLMSYLRRYNLHLVFFQALIIYALIWWASSARSGRIRAPQSAQHIESREFLSALANIYGKARLQGFALHWFEQRLVLALRHIFHNSELKSIDDADLQQVTLRLREIGVSNFRGFEAYMSFRKSLLAKNKKKAFASDGQVLWNSIKTLPEKEFVALAQLAIQLERQWLGHGGIQSGEKLLLDAAQRNQLLTIASGKAKAEEAEQPAQENPEAEAEPKSDEAEQTEEPEKSAAESPVSEAATDEAQAPESQVEEAPVETDTEQQDAAVLPREVTAEEQTVNDNQGNPEVPEGKDDDGNR